MSATAVTVRVPATSANLGAGFDCLGLALDMFASVTVTFCEAEQPPTEDVGEKMVVSAVRHAYQRLGKPMPGVRARYQVAIPLGRGLGASAVARVAGLLAVNEFERQPFDEQALLDMASELEGHGDNACPALFGGLQVCVQGADGHYVRAAARFPGEAHIALLIPDHSMPTKEARKALPDVYSKADTVHNIGRAALFVAAMASGRLELLAEATDDRVHQRQRASLFPPLFDIFAAARAAGAYAAWLSGAGSSVAAICPEAPARAVANAMLATAKAAGYDGRALVTRIAREGATVSRVELVDA